MVCIHEAGLFQLVSVFSLFPFTMRFRRKLTCVIGGSAALTTKPVMPQGQVFKVVEVS